MASRRRSRERALQVLFDWDLRRAADQSETDIWRAIDDFYETLHSEEDTPERLDRDQFMEQLVKGTSKQVAHLDQLIGAHAAHWKVERMPGVDRNILRLAAFEMTERQLPPAVIIDEALELTRRFAGDESVSFVNGVLDAIHRDLKANTATNPAVNPTAKPPVR